MYPTVRISTSDPTRQRTPELWRGVLEQFANGSEFGYLSTVEFVDEVDATADDADGSGETRFAQRYLVQNSAAGGTNTNFLTLTSPDDYYGAARLEGDTGTDWFGVSACGQNKWIKTPKHSTDPREVLVCEYLVDLSGSDTYFLGLGEETSEFLSATGTLPTDSDYIGFYRLDAGRLRFVCANDNNGGTAVTADVNVVEVADISADPVKLGFRVNSDGTVEIFVAEAKIVKESDDNADINIAETAIPIETLNEVYETQRGATGDLAAVVLDFDRIDIYNR